MTAGVCVCFTGLYLHFTERQIRLTDHKVKHTHTQLQKFTKSVWEKSPPNQMNLMTDINILHKENKAYLHDQNQICKNSAELWVELFCQFSNHPKHLSNYTATPWQPCLSIILTHEMTKDWYRTVSIVETFWMEDTSLCTVHWCNRSNEDVHKCIILLIIKDVPPKNSSLAVCWI